jgi:hypothetical protein
MSGRRRRTGELLQRQRRAGVRVAAGADRGGLREGVDAGEGRGGSRAITRGRGKKRAFDMIEKDAVIEAERALLGEPRGDAETRRERERYA